LFDLGRGNNGNASPAVIETPTSPDVKETPAPLIAKEDFATIVANKEPEVTGNVLDNDSNGDFATLTSSVVGKYGYIIFNNDGSFSYALDSNSPEVIALKARELVSDRFTYSYSDKLGNSVSSALNVRIIGNPVDGSGNTIFKQPENSPFDNVDIEFNNRSAQATPLNSALNIKGHLYKSSDKDWYKIPSNGNESLIFEVCPQGSSCFGQKSWVLYIFDSSLLTTAMEERVYQFSRWLDETGTTEDLSGNTIISSGAGISNHMYLAYRKGFFDGALIGVVDPCFGSLNTVEVGLPVNPNNADGTPVLDNAGNPLKPQDYLIAISSPLKGDGVGDCGVGDVVLNKAGRSALGSEAPTIKDNGDGTFSTIPGKAKTYTTTEEYIVVAPNSDDQYTIKVTSTGRNPLLSAEAQKSSSALSTAGRTLKIPKIRIGEQLFSANLELRSSVAGQPLLFSVADIAALGADAIADAFQATYNPSNQQVVFPRVTVSDTGDAYSVILQYHVATANTAAWLEVVQATLIQ
jgi:VCBS repeat-containing protein